MCQARRTAHLAQEHHPRSSRSLASGQARVSISNQAQEGRNQIANPSLRSSNVFLPELAPVMDNSGMVGVTDLRHDARIPVRAVGLDNYFNNQSINDIGEGFLRGGTALKSDRRPSINGPIRLGLHQGPFAHDDIMASVIVPAKVQRSSGDRRTIQG